MRATCRHAGTVLGPPKRNLRRAPLARSDPGEFTTLVVISAAWVPASSTEN